MRILLFGKNGQVARSFAQSAGDAHEVIIVGSAAVDLSKAGAARAAIDQCKPDFIVNAAAYTAVDKAEEDIERATQINAAAVEEIAAAAKLNRAGFIHISTDYVFDGRQSFAYAEDHPTAPLNIYGTTKLQGETRALAANENTIILRTSWVFSEYGANFVKTMLRLAANRNELSIVADQTGGPTGARDIAGAVLMIAEKKNRGGPGAGLYHYQGSPAVSWADFARKIFELAQQRVTVNDIATSQFPTPAARPLQTVLDCSKINRDFGIAQPDWRARVQQVLKALKEEEDAS